MQGSRIKDVTFEVVCDVTNPLIGATGAAKVYGPQKGALPQQIVELDAGLAHLAELIKKELGVDVANIPGAGAAGGLGAGLCAFMGAELKKGIEIVMGIIGLEKNIAGADLVLTSEGRMDFQTKYDKAPVGVAKIAKKHGVPCIAICGVIGERIEELQKVGIDAAFSLCQTPMSSEESIKNGKSLLKKMTEQVVRSFIQGNLRK